jgi:cytochrome c553
MAPGIRWTGLLAALALIAVLAAGSARAQSAFDPNVKWGSKVKEALDALQLQGDAKRGEEIFGICAACHMPTGWGDPAGTFPQLAGQHPTVIIKQIADIRARNRKNPTMLPFAMQIEGSQDLADLSAYVQTLPMNPNNPKGAGTDLAYGDKLFKENCVRCHGEVGQGNLKDSFPLIGGQTFNYIVRQLKEIRDGLRMNANPDMVKQVNGFTDRDFLAVADYVSRLRTPNHLRNLEKLKN